MKTFFFRNANYSITEMIDRIYAEDFIDIFKRYLPKGLPPTKKNCLMKLGDTFSTNQAGFEKAVKSAFNLRGRKGDRLFVHLYKYINLNIQITKELKVEIATLIGTKKNIKELNSLSLNLDFDLYLEDVTYNQSSVDFRFKVNKTEIVMDPFPQEEIKTSHFELRLYTATGILAAYRTDATDIQTNQILSVISLLIKKHDPKVEKIQIDETQLIIINQKLKGLISSPKFQSDDDLRIDIYGMNHTNESNEIVEFIGKSNLQLYELTIDCLIEGHACNLKLTKEGVIQIPSHVTPEVLDFIILQLNWVIFNKKYYAKSDNILRETFKKIKPTIINYRLNAKVADVLSDFNKLFEGVQINNQQKKLLHTVLINVGIDCSSVILKPQIHDTLTNKLNEDNIDLSSYNNLINFYSDYFLSYHEKNRSESNGFAIVIFYILYKLFNESQSDVVNIIESYKKSLGEWSEWEVQKTS